MIYDGGCGFCTRSVGWLKRMDRAHVLEFIGSQDSSLPARFPDITLEAMQAQMHLVTPEGGILAGADAFREIFRVLPGLRWTPLLWSLPGFLPFARWVYAGIARNRYLLGGRMCDSDACRVHHPHRR